LDALVIGAGDLAGEVARQFEERDAKFERLLTPTDHQLTRAVRTRPRAVVVISHDDIAALRYALVAEHAMPGIALLVTVFDATVAAQLRKAVPNCHVVSLADVAAPLLASDCLDVERKPPSRPRKLTSRIASTVLPLDASSRLLVYGVFGLVGILASSTIVSAAVFDEPLVSAFYEATKAAATVDADHVAEQGPPWYKALSAASILLAALFTAAATAGLINRLLSRRLVAIVGRRTLPRSDHVIVVGLGQVGLRLCLLLMRSGVRTLAIERDPNTSNVHLAKRLGVPVVVGDGTERGLLLRLGARRAVALASVTSDDHINIAVSVAALAANEELRVVLRAGDDDAVTETRALFPIGVARDVNRITAAHFADLALGKSSLVSDLGRQRQRSR